MKKLLLILPLIFCALISCQDKQAMAELEELKAQKEIEKQNMALVQRILEEGDKTGAAILNEVCTSDYKMYFPSNAEPISLEEHIELWTAFITAFPDLTHKINEIIAEGDMVSTREVLTGTHEGEFEGLPPTGKKIELSGICIWRITEGKLVEYWTDADILGLMQQLGMELKLKETE
jgi:predicted ester cyclase